MVQSRCDVGKMGAVCVANSGFLTNSEGRVLEMG